MDTTSSDIAYEVPIFYATTEGQTRRIAEYLAAVFRDQGFTSHALEVTTAEAQRVDWTREPRSSAHRCTSAPIRPRRPHSFRGMRRNSTPGRRHSSQSA